LTLCHRRKRLTEWWSRSRALDVALVSSIAALTAAVVTPVVTWIVTGMRNRQERWSRVYEDRRAAYLSILSEGYRSIEVLEAFADALERNDPASPAVLPECPASRKWQGFGLG
jgi:hypothetical protein